MDVRPEQLGARLDEIFRTRAERGTLVTSAPEVPFGAVAPVVDIVTAHVDRVALLPGGPPLNPSDPCMDISVRSQERKVRDGS